MSAVDSGEAVAPAPLLRTGDTPAAAPAASTPSAGWQRHSRRHHREEPRETPLRTPFIPLALLALAVLIWVGFQTVQLIGERQRLFAAVESQDVLVQNSQKLRVNLDSLATETAKLAEQGNASARLLVEELRKRGVTINTNAQSGK
jgi:hypothetical protein